MDNNPKHAPQGGPDKSKIALGILGLAIVVALTGVFGSAPTELARTLEEVSVLGVLRVVGGLAIVAVSASMALSLRRRGTSGQTAEEDAARGGAWLQVALVFLVGAVLLGWGVADIR